MLSSLLIGLPEIIKGDGFACTGAECTLIHGYPQKFSAPSVPLMIIVGQTVKIGKSL